MTSVQILPLATPARPLIDGFGRRVTYLRVSVTDRCDFRCRYCMAEHMTFAPSGDLLTIGELEQITAAFVRRGVRHVRLTGGEPLVRRGVTDLAAAIGTHLGRGLDELTLTTNGSQLRSHAPALCAAGMRRINVSLDTLDPARFAHITRRGRLPDVLTGIAAARDAGLAVKINMVALRGLNEDEIEPMVEWCAVNGHDLTLIETMPLGDVEGDRTDHYLPLSTVRARLDQRWTLRDIPHRTGGPARYVRVGETGQRLGFITPLTNHFCATCNRVRLTATGTLFLCLGQSDSIDLRAVLRAGGDLDAALDRAMRLKPERHDFAISDRGAAPAVPRHMSVTGG